MSGKKIGVIAGGPVDTQMGVDFLFSKGLDANPYPAAKAAREQIDLQMSSSEVRTNKVREILEQIKSDGMDSVMVYCNSLSATVDMDQLSEELNIKIVTPLHAYQKLALQFCNLGVIAGNSQGLAGIERAILSVNKDCNIIGLSMLPLVLEIEKKTSPQAIIEKLALQTVLKMYQLLEIDALILGCTHFPYLYDELVKHTCIPILNPAELMYQLLVQNSCILT
ncbi:MAG: aspartate/glutamate racemase family protein [Dehalobacterium sp.]